MENNTLYESLSPFSNIPKKSVRIQEYESPSNAKHSFMNVMIKAKQSFMNVKSTQSEEEMKLEDIVGQSIPAGIPWPPIRQWVPALIHEPRLILNSFIGGLIVSLVIVPQSMAYCTMMNFPVEYGVNSCIVALIIYSLFGTSKQMSIGPLSTTYFLMAQCIDTYGLPDDEKVPLARTMTMLIGLWMIILGCTQMSFIENVFSEPIIFGFIQATSFLIVIEQIGKMCHVKLNGRLWDKIYQLIIGPISINKVGLSLGISTILLFFFIQFLKKRYFPKSLILVLMPFIIPAIATFISYMLDFPEKYHIETTKGISQGFPAFEPPPLTYHYIWTTWADALKIAIVSFSTSLLITKQLGKKYNYETNIILEFFALGFANFSASFFTSFPAFGSLYRSPIIEITGAKSQLAGMVTGFGVIFQCFTLTAVLEQIPVTVINGFVFYSCLKVFGDMNDVIFWAKHFRTDFVFYIIALFLGLTIGSANGLLLSIIISLLYILKSSSRPIWSFRAFEPDEEKLETFNIHKIRKNTMLLVDSINENKEMPNIPEIDIKATWLVNLKRLTDINEGYESLTPLSAGMRTKPHLKAEDICLCHNWKCDRKCHIVVIGLHGSLTYVNVKCLKEQAEFMTIDVDGHILEISKKTTIVKNTIPERVDEKEENLIQNPLEYKQYEMQANPDNFEDSEESMKEIDNQSNVSPECRKLSIRAIIFECERLNEVDYTSLNALKGMTEDFANKNKKVWIKFSEMHEKIKRKFDLFKFNPDCLDMSSKNTMAVLYKCCADILKAETN